MDPNLTTSEDQPAAAAAPSSLPGTDALTATVTAPASAPVDTQNAAPATATVATEDGSTPQPAGNAPPSRQGGIAGIMDSVLNMLSNRDTSTQTIDANGRRVVTPGQPLSRGQQIAQIALTALKGATTAAAAPPGPGHVGAGVAAAVGQAIGDQQAAAHAKQENADHDFAIQQKAKLDNVNYQLATRKIVAGDFELQQKGVKATQENIDFANKLDDREKGLGSYDLGVYKDERELPSVMAKQPAFMQKLYKEQGIVAVPVYGADGTRQGIHVYERKPDTNAALAPEGTVAHKFTLGDKPGDPPTMSTFTPVGASNADIDSYNRKAMLDQQAYEKAQDDDAKSKAQAAEASANAAAKPAEVRARMIEAQSGAAKNYAEAHKANQEAAQIAGNNPSSDTDDSIVRGMLDKSVDIRTISSLRKDRREQLVRKAMAADPNFNEKQYEAAMDTVKDFSEPSGAGYKAIQSLNKFTGHAAGLIDTFAELRNGGSPLLNKPINAIKTSALGKTAMTDVLQYMDAAGNEHMNYMLGGRAPHSEDVKAREASMNTSMTPAQLEGAVKSDMRIQLTQLGAMNQRHIQTVGRPAYGMIDPSTKEIYRKAGLEDYARKELGAAYDGPPSQQQQQQQPQQPQQQPAAIPSNHPQQAAAAGVPAGAQAGYSNGKLVGYQDAQGWHSLTGAK